MPAPRNQRATPETSPQVVRVPPALAPDCSPWLNPLSLDYHQYPGAALPKNLWPQAGDWDSQHPDSEDAGALYFGSDDEGADAETNG